MNKDQIETARHHVERISQIDIPAKIAEAFPDQNIDELKFGAYGVSEIVSLSQRVLEGFNVMLEQDAGHFLRSDFFWGDESVPIPRLGISFEAPRKLSLIDTLQTMHQALASADIQRYSEALTDAIGYQITTGFWRWEAPKPRRQSPNRLSRLFEDLSIRKEQFIQLFKDIQAVKKTYEEHSEEREHAVQAVAQELEEAKNTVRELATLLQGASDSNGQITSLLSTQKSSVQTANNELSEIERQREEASQTIASLAQTLADAEKRLAHMQEKEGWVNELAGTAAAGALGHKFESRRNQLGVSSRLWLAGTVLSVIGAAAWLGISHRFFVTYTSDPWLTLALNFGLLLPAIFIVGFFAKQFSKVRQFEEEYAFRSAISMTLGAFADRLKAQDPDYNKLILETVEKLYKLPVLLAERKAPTSLFGRTNPTETIKAATELVREVKSPLDH